MFRAQRSMVVDHDRVERAAGRVSQERGELRTLLDPVGVCADPLVGVNADERQAMLFRVPLDLTSLSVEGVAVDLLLGRDADVPNDSSDCWLHRSRLLRMTARATSAHSRIMCSTAARSAWSSLLRGFASGSAIADLPGLSGSFPDPMGASAPPQAMKADRASLLDRRFEFDLEPSVFRPPPSEPSAVSSDQRTICGEQRIGS